MKTFNLHNDPTETMEEFKEYTPEEVFYNDDSIEVPEHALIYIEYLERRLKAITLTKSDLFELTSPRL